MAQDFILHNVQKCLYINKTSRSTVQSLECSKFIVQSLEVNHFAVQSLENNQFAEKLH